MGQYVSVDWLFLLACAVLGLFVGSLVNIVIVRVPAGRSMIPLSLDCPRCGAATPSRNRIPVVSWLISRVPCRQCGATIPATYPLVEVGTALLFLVVGLRFGLNWELPAYLYLAAVSVALAVIDLDVKRLPNVIVLPSYVVGGVLLLAPTVAAGLWLEYRTAWLAALTLFLLYYALAWIYPAGMGFGDVKLAFLLGLYLGWLGWGALIVGAFFGFLSGALIGALLMMFGGAGRKTKIPFGPFMLIGTWIAILWGQAIANWYAEIALPS
jgi:leader peptidase (prepilin peptidase)/N-methyltransferase